MFVLLCSLFATSLQHFSYRLLFGNENFRFHLQTTNTMDSRVCPLSLSLPVQPRINIKFALAIFILFLSLSPQNERFFWLQRHNHTYIVTYVYDSLYVCMFLFIFTFTFKYLGTFPFDYACVGVNKILSFYYIRWLFVPSTLLIRNRYSTNSISDFRLTFPFCLCVRVSLCQIKLFFWILTIGLFIGSKSLYS